MPMESPRCAIVRVTPRSAEAGSTRVCRGVGPNNCRGRDRFARVCEWSSTATSAVEEPSTSGRLGELPWGASWGCDGVHVRGAAAAVDAMSVVCDTAMWSCIVFWYAFSRIINTSSPSSSSSSESSSSAISSPESPCRLRPANLDTVMSSTITGSGGMDVLRLERVRGAVVRCRSGLDFFRTVVHESSREQRAWRWLGTVSWVRS